ncbi:LytTR family DNA-binding domain-containing protein [Dokdonella soli]|uniref:LytTR family DNA-binding domain-containing protein n=1 Tax=Dokdonella soli TaxID=529810 RepID=A0ABN1ICP4_9GAMM
MDVMIVDDEPAARRILRGCCAAEPDLDVVGEYADAQDALAAIRRRVPHLLFLDIQMNTMSGMQLARSLDPGVLPLIVFVTAYDRYALEAFDVSAVDYLLKPFDEERFRAMLTRVRYRYGAESVVDRQAALETLITQLERTARSAAEARPRLLADAGGCMQMVDVAQIEVVEADRNYVTLRVGKDAFHARSTLQQAEDAMRSQPMLRVSRSCLVNVNHVREVNRTPRGDFILVLAGGATVTSSEGYRDKVRAHFERLKI